MSNIYADMQMNLTDYQDEITCTLYTQGCRLHCPWCHNKQLWPETGAKYRFGDVIHFLDKQRVKPGAVAFSGGEPMLHAFQVIMDSCCLRNEGYKTILYTSRIGPDPTKFLTKSFDKIVLSVKGGPEFYGEATYIELLNSVMMMSSIDFDLKVQVLESIHGEDTERISGPFRKISTVIN
jgi:pyruvate formate lyase activating enzyme